MTIVFLICTAWTSTSCVAANTLSFHGPYDPRHCGEFTYLITPEHRPLIMDCRKVLDLVSAPDADSGALS